MNRSFGMLSILLPFLVALTACGILPRRMPEDSPKVPSHPELTHLVRDDRAGFEIRMPAPGQSELASFETPRGSLPVVTYTCSRPQAIYAISVNAFFPDVLAGGVSYSQLVAARNAALRSTGGEILEETHLDISGYPGLEMTVRAEDGYYRIRLLITDSRVFQVVVAGGNEEVRSELSTAFLESLVISGGGEP